MSASWGNWSKPSNQQQQLLAWRHQLLPESFVGSLLPYGQGRSYGDSCLNDNGTVLSSKRLRHYLAFDKEQGTVRAEAGLTVGELLTFLIPHGWFLAVLPGTQAVTLGGAVANDVHGKNHLQRGNFSRWVRCFELLRSDKQRLLCSRQQHAELFTATLGGLGLTGFITWVELQLVPIHSAYMQVQSKPFSCLQEFFQLNQQLASKHEYTVAWFDASAVGRHVGRGIYSVADHATDGDFSLRTAQQYNFPCYMPNGTLNSFSIRTFNQLYYRWHARLSKKKRLYYRDFFFPLDAIGRWNRLYGRRGFLQYQCVIPYQQQEEFCQQLLQRISVSAEASFLTVIKTLGDVHEGGFCSFPQQGTTVALDFPFRGQSTLQLLNALDEIVLAAAGRVYCAKDARMSASSFQAFYPHWQQLSALRDKQFSSSFWRRVTKGV